MLIAAEREKKQVSQVLALLEDTQRETEFFLSAITVMELEHGWYRADSAERAAGRRRYLDEIFAIIPVEPFTRQMGTLAARINAEARKAGHSIDTADLLIGTTALHLGYSLATRNVRHFEMVPGLKVVSL